MRFLRPAVFLSLVAVGITPAWAQFGLYGSPEVLYPPRPEAAAGGYGYTTPAAYPATYPVAPRPQPAYARPAAAYGRGYVQPAAVDPTLAAPPSVPAAPVPVPRMPQPAPTLMEPVGPVAPPQGQSVVNQMLNDPAATSGGYYGNPAGTSGGCYTPALERFQKSVCGEGGQPCGDGSCYGSPWYGSAYALVMSRDHANKVWTTYQTDNLPNQMQSTQLELQWKWGGEIRFGRRFCCNEWAVEGTYWTLDPFTGFES